MMMPRISLYQAGSSNGGAGASSSTSVNSSTAATPTASSAVTTTATGLASMTLSGAVVGPVSNIVGFTNAAAASASVPGIARQVGGRLR